MKIIVFMKLKVKTEKQFRFIYYIWKHITWIFATVFDLHFNFLFLCFSKCFEKYICVYCLYRNRINIQTAFTSFFIVTFVQFVHGEQTYQIHLPLKSKLQLFCERLYFDMNKIVCRCINDAVLTDIMMISK